MRHIFNRIKQKIRNNSNDRGSVVIEASISLTAFMFLVITLLTLVNACIVQARVGVALHEAAKEFSEYGYVYSLFGFNDEQKKYYEELSGYRMDIDDAIGAMGDTKEALDTIAGIDPLSDSAWDDWNSSLDTLEESGQKYEKIYENIKADPGEYFLGMGKVALNEGFEFFKGTVAGQFIAKGLMYKHLREDSKQDPNQFLRRHGVKDGLSGLKLYNSTVFTNGTDDIAFICQYKIRMIRLLNIDVEYEVCQLAKTKAWTGNALVRDKDNDPTNNETPESDDEGEVSGGDGEEPSDGSEDESPEDTSDDPSEDEDPSDSSDEGSGEEDESPEDAYKEMRKKMADKYGEDVVAAIEKEYGDETKDWSEEDWSIAAIIYAMDHDCPEILDEEERCEYEKEINEKYGLCFVAGTQIKTSEGNKNIENIGVGDEVYSYDYINGEQALKHVTELYVHEASDLVTVKLADENICATATHPFYVLGEGFKEAWELNIGDDLLLIDGSTEEVDEVIYSNFEVPIEVYNFSVEDWHTYYVSDVGVLVHNECSAAVRKKMDYRYGDDAVKRLEETYGKDVVSKWSADNWESHIDEYNKNNPDKRITIQNGPYVRDGKPYGRPPVGGATKEKRAEFERKVYEWQKKKYGDPDVLTEPYKPYREIDWEPGQPRKDVVDFGHKKGKDYDEMFKKYVNREISLQELKDFQANWKNFRLELPSENRNHKHE